MTRSEAVVFAQGWIEDWNRRDVEAVLAHFAEDAVFTSPKAAVITGSPLVQGKAALAAYWQRASGSITELRFTLDRALWDPEARELLVLYEASIDGTTCRACELMRFDAAGRQVAGEALYGANVA